MMGLLICLLNSVGHCGVVVLCVPWICLKPLVATFDKLLTHNCLWGIQRETTPCIPRWLKGKWTALSSSSSSSSSKFAFFASSFSLPCPTFYSMHFPTFYSMPLSYFLFSALSYFYSMPCHTFYSLSCPFCSLPCPTFYSMPCPTFILCLVIMPALFRCK